MKMVFADKYNLFLGSVVAVLTVIFGTYWYLFAGYLLLNVIDWLTGWYKAYRNHEESSKVGLKGIVKKTGYWVIILLGFLIPDMFVEFGRDLLDVDLSVLINLGYFTLAMLLVNEIRSVLENLVACGYNVPRVLVQGLRVTTDLIDGVVDGNPQKEG